MSFDFKSFITLTQHLDFYTFVFFTTVLLNLQLVLEEIFDKSLFQKIKRRNEKEVVGVRMHSGQNTDEFRLNTDYK